MDSVAVNLEPEVRYQYAKKHGARKSRGRLRDHLIIKLAFAIEFLLIILLFAIMMLMYSDIQSLKANTDRQQDERAQEATLQKQYHHQVNLLCIFCKSFI